jgi:hypothetical protein
MNLPTIHPDVAQRFNQVAVFATDSRVLPRQVGEQRDGDSITGTCLSQYDLVIEANEKATDAIHPQQEPFR